MLVTARVVAVALEAVAAAVVASYFVVENMESAKNTKTKSVQNLKRGKKNDAEICPNMFKIEILK